MGQTILIGIPPFIECDSTQSTAFSIIGRWPTSELFRNSEIELSHHYSNPFHPTGILPSSLPRQQVSLPILPIHYSCKNKRHCPSNYFAHGAWGCHYAYSIGLSIIRLHWLFKRKVEQQGWLIRRGRNAELNPGTMWTLSMRRELVRPPRPASVSFDEARRGITGFGSFGRKKGLHTKMAHKGNVGSK